MKYKELLNALNGLTERELNQDVTVSLDISEEAMPVKSVSKIKSDDFLSGVLDDGHVVLAIDF